jgi:hypothetical protein
MTNRINALWLRLPPIVRSAIIDIIEAAVAAVIALNLAFPTSLADAKALAAVAAIAAGHAALSAARRKVLPIIGAAIMGWWASVRASAG